MDCLGVVLLKKSSNRSTWVLVVVRGRGRGYCQFEMQGKIPS